MSVNSASYKNKFFGKYIGDLVYGANDGIITTFVVIAGTTGAGFSPLVTVVLGFVNLLADGLSMGVSDFLGIKSEKYYAESVKQQEKWEIKHNKPEATKEIREIFQSRGFEGKDLDRAVEIVTSNKRTWLETMMRDEQGVIEDPRDDPKKHGLATFLAFSTVGFFSLLPYLLPNVQNRFLIAAAVAVISLFVVGSLRHIVTAVGWLRGGLEMLTVGGVTAVIAYFVGFVVKQIVGS